jgi:hypothetical protein
MQTPIRIFSPFGLMNGVNRTYTTAAPFINRYANQEQREYPVPVRLFSDDDDFPPQVRNHTVDPRYVLRRVDAIHSVHEPTGRVSNIDYSMCVDTDDEKAC